MHGYYKSEHIYPLPRGLISDEAAGNGYALTWQLSVLKRLHVVMLS